MQGILLAVREQSVRRWMNIIIIAAIVLVGSFSMIQSTYALGEPCTKTSDCPKTAEGGQPQCVKKFCTLLGIEAVEQGTAENTLNLGDQDLVTTITQIINLALSLLGIIAVIIILIGGFKWMTAGGNEDKVGEARKMIFAGIIGLAIILSAWAIAKFVITQLADVTDAPL